MNSPWLDARSSQRLEPVGVTLIRGWLTFALKLTSCLIRIPRVGHGRSRIDRPNGIDRTRSRSIDRTSIARDRSGIESTDRRTDWRHRSRCRSRIAHLKNGNPVVGTPPRTLYVSHGIFQNFDVPHFSTWTVRGDGVVFCFRCHKTGGGKTLSSFLN